MVYDVEKGEYLAVQGRALNIGDVFALDTTDALSREHSIYKNGADISAAL